MAKIHSSTDTGKAITPFGRSELEEFPQEPVASAEPPAGEEAAEQLDPESIRMMVFEEAKAEAEKMVQEAYQEGLARGEEAGRAAFDERIAGIAALLDQSVEAVQAERQAFLESLEPQVLQVVEAIARKVVERECGEETLALARDAAARSLALVADAQELVVRVRPEALETMRENEASLLEKFPDDVKLRIEASESVEAGGCVVETEESQIDAQPGTLLKQVLDDIFGGGDGPA